MAKNTTRVQICTPGANLHPGANCAHERGFKKAKLKEIQEIGLHLTETLTMFSISNTSFDLLTKPCCPVFENFNGSFQNVCILISND